MPIYEYECTQCGTRFERLQKFSDAPVTVCPECEGAVRRLIQPAGIVFKGSGWYVTDSRGKSAVSTSEKKTTDSTTTSGSTAATETATVSKSDSSD